MKNHDEFLASPGRQDEVEDLQNTEEEYCLFCGANLSHSIFSRS